TVGLGGRGRRCSSTAAPSCHAPNLSGCDEPGEDVRFHACGVLLDGLGQVVDADVDPVQGLFLGAARDLEQVEQDVPVLYQRADPAFVLPADVAEPVHAEADGYTAFLGDFGRELAAVAVQTHSRERDVVLKPRRAFQLGGNGEVQPVAVF